MTRRKDDAEEILISSDDDCSDGGDSEDTSDEDESTDDVSADDDDADDDDEDETDDEDYNVDDDTEDDDEEDDDSHDGNARCKARNSAIPEFSAKRDVESIKAGKKKQRQRLKKQGGRANSKTLLSGEDQKHFDEALNIMRGGDLEELKLEHCKAYLRHYSLRQTGSKQTLLDRVQEHVELKACGGMVKYPRSTFTINCTGDACTGDVVIFQQRVKNYKKANRSSKQPSTLWRTVAGRIVKESYGSAKQQHTFTVEVLWSKGRKALPPLYPLLIKGRNLYRLKTFRQRWANEGERKRVLEEKHSRGAVARNAREDRISGKRPSCSNQRHPSKRKAELTLKREQTVKISRKDVNARVPSSLSGKAATSKETVFRKGSVDSSVVLSQRVFEDTACGTSRSVKCVLNIKASFAGLLIGSKGRNIEAISRGSGARLQICENPLNPASRLVEISGVPEEVQVAKGMVIKSFLDKGLPPPVVVTPGNTFLIGGMPAVGTREQALVSSSHMRDLRIGGHFLGLW